MKALTRAQRVYQQGAAGGGRVAYNFERRRKSGVRRRAGKVSKPSKEETIQCEACGGFVSEQSMGEVGGRCSRCGRRVEQSSWLGKPSSLMLAIVGGAGVLLFYFAIPAVLRSLQRRTGGDGGAGPVV